MLKDKHRGHTDNTEICGQNMYYANGIQRTVSPAPLSTPEMLERISTSTEQGVS